MKIQVRGCTFDSDTGIWSIWMNKPKGLNVEDKKLYNRFNQECYLKNVKNKKGIEMLVLRGKFVGAQLNSFLIVMREDLTTYINKLKKAETK